MPEGLGPTPTTVRAACGGEEFRIGMFPAGGHEPYAARLLAAARAGHQIFKSFAEDGALAFLHSHSAS